MCQHPSCHHPHAALVKLWHDRVQGFMGEVRSAMLADLPASMAGAVLSCMTRGLAVEALLELGNPAALQALLAMPAAASLRLLQHLTDADALGLAKVCLLELLLVTTAALSVCMADLILMRACLSGFQAGLAMGGLCRLRLLPLWRR